MNYLATAFLFVATGVHAQDGTQFQTPSGNIHCVIYEDEPPGVRCDMVEATPTFTSPPPDCDLDWGTSFYVDTTSAQGALYCHGDTVILFTMPVLDYGFRAEVAGISCLSERSGVTCTTPAGHGFTISKARQSLF